MLSPMIGFMGGKKGTPAVSAHWLLNDISLPNLLSVSGNNDGLYSGTPTLGVVSPLQSGTAVDFLPAGAYATVTDRPDLDIGLEDFGLNLWFKLGTSTTKQVQVMYSKRTGLGTIGPNLQYFFQDGNNLGIIFGDSVVNVQYSNYYLTNNWYMCTVNRITTGGTTVYEIWVSGVRRLVQTVLPTDMSNAANVSIAHENASNQLEGSLDDIRWKKGAAFTLAEIQSFYAERTPLPAITQTERWALNDLSLPTMASETTNNNGTYTGAVTLGNPPATHDSTTSISMVATQGAVIPHATDLDPGVGAFAINFWIMATGSINPTETLYVKRATPAGQGFDIRVTSSNALEFHVNALFASGSADWDDGEWHMITAQRFNAGGQDVLQLWFDAVAINAVFIPTTTDAANGADARLSSIDGVTDFAGAIDDVRWRKGSTFSDPEIDQLYSQKVQSP